MITDKVFIDFLKSSPKHVDCGVYSALVLPPNYPKVKIEKLRLIDGRYTLLHGEHLIANFLSDDERPSDVPKY